MRKAFNSVLSVILASFCVLSGFSALAFATEAPQAESVEGESVDASVPQEINLDVDDALDFGQLNERGVSYTSSFKVRNNSANDAKIELSFDAANYASLDERWMKAGDWLAIVGGQTRQTIPANDEKEIRVRVSVPADAETGSQYATIVVKSGDERYLIDVQMALTGEGELKYAGTLKENWVGAIAFSDKIIAKAEVQNTGNAGFVAQYSLRYRNGLSGAAEWTEVVSEKKVVPNGLSVKFDSALEKEMGYGVYTVEQKVLYIDQGGDQIEETRTQVAVRCPEWLKVAVIAVLVIVVLATVAMICRRAKKKTNKPER